jgi:hypothetical protein
MALGGTAMAPPQNVIERGTILAVDAQRQIYRVALNSGRTMQMARIRTHLGDISILPNGTIVAVTFALGLPYIMGVLPPETLSVDDEDPFSVTDADGFGGNDPVFSRGLGANSRGAGEPRDLGPGDFVGLSSDGASVAALQGKIAQIRGSALAKVQAFGDNDLVQIIAGVLRTVTWMGESQVVNNNGKTSFIWRGGTDQLTQTGQDEERYTIKLDVGDTGNMIRLEVCNRDGQTVFRFHVDPQGRVDLFAAGGFNQHSGNSENAQHPVRYYGNLEEVITGGVTREIGSDALEDVGGGKTLVTSTDCETIVGQDYILRVNRNSSLDMGGDLSEVVNGDKKSYSLGDMLSEVIYPESVHVVKTNGGEARTETSGGNITMSPGSGTFQVNADADGIILGNGGISHATKFEELSLAVTALAVQINAINALIATHVHPLAGPIPGSTGPAPTLAPIVTPPLAIAPDISGARSSAVKLA